MDRFYNRSVTLAHSKKDSEIRRFQKQIMKREANEV